VAELAIVERAVARAYGPRQPECTNTFSSRALARYRALSALDSNLLTSSSGLHRAVPPLKIRLTSSPFDSSTVC
jgi:hypothetical protein